MEALWYKGLAVNIECLCIGNEDKLTLGIMVSE